eukprot:9777906-Ditylum_brightwellii.AAC.1
MALMGPVLSSQARDSPPIVYTRDELILLMSLTLRTYLCKANHSTLVVAHVGPPCLDISQWVTTPSVRSTMDVISFFTTAKVNLQVGSRK